MHRYPPHPQNHSRSNGMQCQTSRALGRSGQCIRVWNGMVTMTARHEPRMTARHLVVLGSSPGPPSGGSGGASRVGAPVLPRRVSVARRRSSCPVMPLECTALHCTALHCTVLHCIALHCTAQWESAGLYSLDQCLLETDTFVLETDTFAKL